MKKDKVLWADDEIDLLKPHILFLEDKGYEVVPAVSGQDALDLCRRETFDIIFLDENMPGLTGLETLAQIKELQPDIPVVTSSSFPSKRTYIRTSSYRRRPPSVTSRSSRASGCKSTTR